jgi:CubicO group peptidase (beta-lactamase class C family)
MYTTEIDSPTLESVVRAAMERWTVPGVVVGILSDGETTVHAWGTANLDTGEALRTDALFRVASISKVFTATLAMTLVDEGLLDLDAPVSRYLPDLRLTPDDVQDRVTMRQLLSHGSGILGDYFVDHGQSESALETAIGHFGSLPRLSDPGELWAYCNSGFHLSGRVIETILATPFDRAMRERVFDPLGLERTCFFAHEAIVYPYAIGHDQIAPDSDEHRVAPQGYPRNRFPAGGVISNAVDLLRFAGFHMSDGSVDGVQVLTPETVAAMHEPQRQAACWADAWGIGWDIREIGGTRVIAHGGSINGFKSQLTLVPSRNFAIVILTNSGRGDIINRVVEHWALSACCGLESTAPKPVAMSDDRLARFAGTYRQRDTTITVAVDSGQLTLTTTAPWPWHDEPVVYPPDVFTPVGDTEFANLEEGSAGEGNRIDIILRADGNPRYLRAGGRLFAFEG